MEGVIVEFKERILMDDWFYGGVKRQNFVVEMLEMRWN